MQVKRAVYLALILGWVTPAHAEDRAAARQAYQHGSQHYKIGEYKEALADFKEAYRQYEEPSFLYNIAQCERALDRREAALREYKMYLAESPSGDNADAARALIARLQREIDQERAQKQALALRTSATASTTSATTLTAQPVAPERPRKKKTWVWGVVGGVVVAGAAVGLAVGLTHDNPATASTSLGTVRPY